MPSLVDTLLDRLPYLVAVFWAALMGLALVVTGVFMVTRGATGRGVLAVAQGVATVPLVAWGVRGGHDWPLFAVGMTSLGLALLSQVAADAWQRRRARRAAEG